MDRRYEYLVARLTPLPDGEIHHQLELLGKNGWKLLLCDDGRWIFLRRSPVDEQVGMALGPYPESHIKRPIKVSACTNRELDVAGLVAKGLNNRMIAEILKLKEQSVKNLVSSIMRKLAVENRTQLALRFYELFPTDPVSPLDC